MRSPILIIRWLGLTIMAVGILFPSKMLVHRFLPTQYIDYLPNYLEGFLIVKFLLIVGGLLTILFADPLTFTFGSGKETTPRLAWPAHDKQIFALLLVGATLLRLPGLNSSLLIDEVFLVQSMITQNPLKIFLHPLGSTHIMNTLPANLLVMGLPPSEAVVRLPAFIAGCITPALLFAALRVRLGSMLAAGTGLFCAVASMHIWFSQQAKGNTMLALGVVLSWLALVKLKKAWRTKWALLYLASMILCGWAHLSGIFVILGQGLALVIIGNMNTDKNASPAASGQAMRWRWFSLHMAGVWATMLVYAPIASFLLRQKQAVTAEEGGASLSGLLQEMIHFFGILDAPAGLNYLLAAIAAIGGISLWKNDRRWLAFSLTPLCLSLVVTVISGSFSYARYQYFFLPPAMLLLSAGIVDLSRLITKQDPPVKTFSILTAVVALCFAVGLKHYYTQPRSNYKAISEWLENNRDDKAVYVIGTTRGGYPALGMTYYTDAFWTGNEPAWAQLDPDASWLIIMLDPLQAAASFGSQVNAVLADKDPIAEFICLGELDQYRVRESRIYEVSATEFAQWMNIGTLTQQETPAFSLTLPDNWERLDDIGKGMLLFGKSPSEGPHDIFRENINVAREIIPEGQTIDDFLAHSLQNMRNMFNIDKFAAFEPAKVGNEDGYHLNYTINAGATTLNNDAYVVVRNNTAYIITCSQLSDTRDRWKPVMDTIIATFTFTK